MPDRSGDRGAGGRKKGAGEGRKGGEGGGRREKGKGEGRREGEGRERGGRREEKEGREKGEGRGREKGEKGEGEGRKGEGEGRKGEGRMEEQVHQVHFAYLHHYFLSSLTSKQSDHFTVSLMSTVALWEVQAVEIFQPLLLL